MRTYIPDTEARMLADANARRRSARSGTRGEGVNLSVSRMRQITAEAEDPFGLDQLVDGTWVEPSECESRVWIDQGDLLTVTWNGSITWSNEPPVMTFSDPVADP